MQIGEIKGKDTLKHLPNFLGDNKLDGKFSGLEFGFKGARGKYDFTLETLAAAIPTGESVFLCLNQSCQQYSAEKTEYTFKVSNPQKLYLKTTTDVAYVVMGSIEFKAVTS